MALWPLTSQSLLDRLRNAEEREAWTDFARLYRPAIYRFSRRMGLQHADADDATQRVLTSVADSFHRRPPSLEQHRFRSWLAQVTRNTVLKLIEREVPKQASGRSDIERLLKEIPAVTDTATAWQTEVQTQLFRAAAATVKANCTAPVWNAFEQTSVQGRSPERVAAELGVSVGVVYASRSRILKRIRRAVAELMNESDSGVAE